MKLEKKMFKHKASIKGCFIMSILEICSPSVPSVSQEKPLTSRRATQRAKLGPYRAKRNYGLAVDKMLLLKIPPEDCATRHQ